MRVQISAFSLLFSSKVSVAFESRRFFARFPAYSSLLMTAAGAPSEPTQAAATSDGQTAKSSGVEEPERKSFHVFPYDTDPLGLLVDYDHVKTVHVIRHAQGTHNVNKEYRSRENMDARLTELGKEQCRSLAQRILSSTTTDDNNVSTAAISLKDLYHSAELIVTSPLTRCMQTTLLTMEPVIQNRKVPVVAHEYIRETVNYNCDRRRTVMELSQEFADRVDFSHLPTDHDAIWEHYETWLGSDESFTKHRESAQLYKVADRARTFFDWLSARPEKHVVICSHRAYLRCLWNFGHTQAISEDAVEQYLDDRRDAFKNVPVVEYQGDSDFASHMQSDYDNCELRSFRVAFRSGERTTS